MGYCQEENEKQETKKCRWAEGHRQRNLGFHTTSAVPRTDHLHATPNWGSNESKRSLYQVLSTGTYTHRHKRGLEHLPFFLGSFFFYEYMYIWVRVCFCLCTAFPVKQIKKIKISGRVKKWDSVEFRCLAFSPPRLGAGTRSTSV